MTIPRFLALAILLSASPAAAAQWLTATAEAVKASKERGLPILVDFHAPWCYSCYYMEQRVLSKPGFAAAADKLVGLKLDVDTPEGAAAKAKHRVTFLPTYVVLAPGGGRELGRIVGEQPEADFLKKLAAIASGGRTDDADVQALHERIGRGDLAAFRGLLAGPSDCRLPYAVFKAQPHAGKLQGGARAQLLSRQKEALARLAEEKLFVARDSRCADFRSGVEALAGVYEDAGQAFEKRALLERAVALLEKDGAVGEDRNRDDDLRYFMQQTKDARLPRLFEGLVAAYPTDYVYAYRYARHLAESGDNSGALSWIEKADKLAYGANRLNVTLVRANVLSALGRKTEAADLLRRDIKAGKATFPKEAQALEKALAGLAR